MERGTPFTSCDSTDTQDQPFARLAVPFAKFLLTKRCPNYIYECMECHGGVGYVEETADSAVMSRATAEWNLVRPGSLIALVTLRISNKKPRAAAAVIQ